MDRKVHSGEMAKAYCCLHLSILFAGFTGILGKLIELPSGVMTWWRLLFTAVILLSGSLFLRGREEVSWRDRLEISGAGLLLALHWIFFFRQHQNGERFHRRRLFCDDRFLLRDSGAASAETEVPMDGTAVQSAGDCGNSAGILG